MNKSNHNIISDRTCTQYKDIQAQRVAMFKV